MRKIVFDIETSNEFSEVGSSEPSALDISIVCIHDSETDSYGSFLQEEFPALWPILERADMLIGYNSNHFDIPLLNKYYPGELSSIKSLDLLSEIKNSLGRRLKLNSVAEATLGEGKSGHGLEAITWWKNGEVEKVREYCLDDVRITKELYEYALSHAHVKYRDFDGLREIPLDTKNWEKTDASALTHTLPF